MRCDGDDARRRGNGVFDAGVTAGVIVGSPAGELIGASCDADLLILGSRGHGGPGDRDSVR